MKPELFFICALVIFIGLPPTSAFAQQNQVTIFVIGTFDYPGAGNSTTPLHINNRGWIIGRYTDAQGRAHGLFRKNANTYATLDFPNAIATSINGINDFGFIVGRYDDAAGKRHGFVAFALAF